MTAKDIQAMNVIALILSVLTFLTIGTVGSVILGCALAVHIGLYKIMAFYMPLINNHSNSSA